MKRLMYAFVLCFLVSCSAGPVYVAKTENEGIQTSYQDPRLNELANQNQATLRAVYQRYQLAKIDVYPNGIGYTALSDDLGKRHYYLLVDVRPRDISFGMGQTTSNERFNEVLQRHFEKSHRFVESGDIGMKGVEGVAFAVHWPVRDLSQCDSHGGFLEYAMIYFPKAEFLSLINGKTSFSNAIKGREIVTSLDMKQASSIRLIDAR